MEINFQKYACHIEEVMAQSQTLWDSGLQMQPSRASRSRMRKAPLVYLKAQGYKAVKVATGEAQPMPWQPCGPVLYGNPFRHPTRKVIDPIYFVDAGIVFQGSSSKIC